MAGENKIKARRPKNVRRSLTRIMSYILKSKWRFGLVVFFLCISTVSGVAGTYFLKPLLNDYIVPMIGSGGQDVDWAPFAGMLLLMGGIYLAGVLSNYLSSRLVVSVSNGALNAIRNDLFNSMQDLPVQFFDTHTHGELMSRYTSDVDTIREAMSQGLSQIIISLITIVSVFIMMLVLSPALTFLAVAVIVLMLLIAKGIGKRSGEYFKRQQKAIGEMNGYIEELIEGQKVVKVFCHEEAVREDFEVLNQNLRNAATNANIFANLIFPIMFNLSYAHYALTAAAGAALVISGRLDIGTIASFLQYTRSFFQPVTQISQQFNNILAALAGAERIFEIIDAPAEIDHGYVTLVNATVQPDGKIVESDTHTGVWAWKHPHGTGEVTYTLLNGNVVFENVRFGYLENEPVLKDISLYAKSGQKIAFVGSTGAGKTTITNLLNRFYEIQEGKIRYDGINIQKIKKDDLRRSLSMVLQDTHLFTGTVRENIRYGNLNATDEEVVAAAKLANAHFFIEHLPQGYDTMLYSDGANLSQGQRQLLSIARAAVADPPVLVLDEATSSIDTRTEALIEKGMDKLMENRTVFVIAHRLSTVRNAKAIMVLEHGEIIERGNHEELIAQKGKYYQLYTGMFELS